MAEPNLPTGGPDTDIGHAEQSAVAVDRQPRRGPDVLTLVMGLIALCAAASALFHWTPPLPLLDPRWLLAGGAVLVGLLLLVASVRPPRGRGPKR
ncbi:MAG TPA: hypothetical protein VH008_08355 [Pseudonocardia sp.]|nr:hypothetical protein [Pseudonocardia sp.]